MKLTTETLFQATLVTSHLRSSRTCPLLTVSPESTSQVRSFLNIYRPLGYGGYLTGVKAENVYGQTYGKISYQSTAGEIQRGIDQPADVKYSSSFRKEFIKHSDKTYETTAQIVGVNRPEDTYKKVSFTTVITAKITYQFEIIIHAYKIYIAHSSCHCVQILRS